MNFKVLIFLTLFALSTAQVRWYNTDNCINHYDFIDYTVLKTVKSICQLTTAVTYAQAQTACNAKGMDLFFPQNEYMLVQFDSSYLQSTYVYNSQTGTMFWGTDWSATNGLWVNGKKTNGLWTAQLNGKQVPYDPLGTFNVTEMASVYNSTNLVGDCKAAKVIQGSFQLVNWDCTKVFYPICEYNNTYNYPPPSNPYTNYYPGYCSSNSYSPYPTFPRRHYNLNACKSIDTIHDDCGNPIKGICELNINKVSNDQAIRACDDYGMDLFVSETMEIHQGFMKFINKKFSSTACGAVWDSTCGLWVGGRRMSNRTNDYARVRDSYLVKMTTQNSTWGMQLPFVPAPAGFTGNCVALKNKNGFVYMDHLCTTLFAPICEFDLRVIY